MTNSTIFESDDCEQPVTLLSIFSHIDGTLKQHRDSLECLIESKLSQQEVVLKQVLSALVAQPTRRRSGGHGMHETATNDTRVAINRTMDSAMTGTSTGFHHQSDMSCNSALRKGVRASTRFESGHEFEAQDRRKHLRAKTMFVEYELPEIQAESSIQERLWVADRNPRFNAVCAIVITANVIFTGVQTEMRAVGVNSQYTEVTVPTDSTAVTAISVGFACIFWCEMLFRMLARGRQYFLEEEYGWNILDLVINVFSAFEVIAELMVRADGSFFRNVKLTRLLRAVRMLRMVRAVRLFRVFRQLRILILAIFSALKSGAWTLLLLLCIMYAFGVAFTTAVIDFVSQNPTDDSVDSLLEQFGSLSAAISTLFQSICGGIDWGPAAGQLANAGAFPVTLFYFFIAVTSMIIMNVMTGIFVQSATESAQYDAEQVMALSMADNDRYIKQLSQICNRLDPGNIGFITLDKLEVLLEDPELMSYFKMVELDPIDAWSLFRVLDTTEKGTISIEDFARGCLRLKGGARRIDMSNMMYTNKWIMNKIARFSQDTEDTLGDIMDSLTALSSQQKTQSRRLTTLTGLSGSSQPTFHSQSSIFCGRSHQAERIAKPSDHEADAALIRERQIVGQSTMLPEQDCCTI
eukprot:TRINITY_DN24219_c1_g1_i2.p1 TRINITY_DN24219_c1_g1~~TRINITY_DN24219_c1_g1_i2.p1  ORF type:complete len:636 (-),score=65.22 TRINITY_DN24219_c1_g1_i2:466-2373(-)